MKFDNKNLNKEIFSFWAVYETEEFYKLRFGSVIEEPKGKVIWPLIVKNLHIIYS
jgi:hypothetical protein